MYDSIKERLNRRGLSPVTMFIGAQKTGKTTLVQEIVGGLGYEPGDVTWWLPTFPEVMLDRWFAAEPFGTKKVLIFDETLTEHLREKLLLRVEDLPVSHSIVITSKVTILDTLFSRAETYRMTHDDAYEPPVYSEVKGVVLALLRAFQNLDGEALNEVATRWNDNHTALLVTWCEEHLTKQFKHFTGEEVDVPARLPILLLRSMVSDVRPRFLIRGPIAELLWTLK